MIHPWEVPHFSRPHHALPLGDGWWRGPACKSPACARALQQRGLEPGRLLPDGSQAFRPPDGPFPAEFLRTAADENDPAGRAAWIEARIAAGRAAWQTRPPRPAFMAILNLTPDSFSDGGELLRAGVLEREAALRVDEGAAFLDLGAESTRPGARPVLAALQLKRLLPAIGKLRPLGVRLSIDTRSAEVARACLEAGAAMINDVSALAADEEMADVVARAGCRVVLMHMRGTPADMASRASYRFLLGEVVDELAARAGLALRQGIAPEKILLDPGIGFAKTAAQSLEWIASIGCLRALGFPVLAGPSRKSFLLPVLGKDRPPAERDGGTAGAAALCAAGGAAVLRLHRGGFVWDAALAAAAAAFPEESVLAARAPCADNRAGQETPA